MKLYFIDSNGNKIKIHDNVMTTEEGLIFSIIHSENRFVYRTGRYRAWKTEDGTKFVDGEGDDLGYLLVEE